MTRVCILVTGSRNWTDQKAIFERLADPRYGTTTLNRKHSVVLHGGARGADSIASRAADVLGFLVESTPYFEELGKQGGVLRNALLVDKLLCYGRHGYQMAVLAFVLSGSVGTVDCIRRVQRAKDKGALIELHELHVE